MRVYELPPPPKSWLVLLFPARKVDDIGQESVVDGAKSRKNPEGAVATSAVDVCRFGAREPAESSRYGNTASAKNWTRACLNACYFRGKGNLPKDSKNITQVVIRLFQVNFSPKNFLLSSGLILEKQAQ